MSRAAGTVIGALAYGDINRLDLGSRLRIGQEKTRNQLRVVVGGAAKLKG